MELSESDARLVTALLDDIDARVEARFDRALRRLGGLHK